ncbi:MAG: PQQ-binding-like beta-propeller repeat protein [Planctomycetota bacterium]
MDTARQLSLPLLLLLGCSMPAFSAQERATHPAPEWGGFRGANGSGTAVGAQLPEALDAEAQLVWKASLPSGYSSPIIAGERVFVTGRDGKQLLTVCIDAGTGEERWRAAVEFEGERPGGNSYAAPTPATDGERVYALFHHVGMVAYDLEGKELWRNSLGAPYNIPHGLATSPLVVDGAVVMQLDQDGGSALVCLAADTGVERWRTVREGALHSYATPAVFTPQGGKPQVVVSGSYQIAGYDLETGARIWWVTGSAWQSKAVPLFYEDLCIVSSFMPSSTEFGVPNLGQSFAEVLAEKDANGDGALQRDEWKHDTMQQTWFIWDLDGDEVLNAREYEYLQSTQTAKGGLFAIDLDVEGKPLVGDVTETHVAWQYDGRRGLSDVVSPVLVDGTVFLLKDGGLLTALDARTGALGKQGRVGEPDSYYASPIAAGGRVFAASLSGQLTLVSGCAEWEPLSSTAVDGKVWSTPALANGRVYVRSETQLYCFGAKDA